MRVYQKPFLVIIVVGIFMLAVFLAIHYFKPQKVEPAPVINNPPEVFPTTFIE
jgi:hypothetical protein